MLRVRVHWPGGAQWIVFLARPEAHPPGREGLLYCVEGPDKFHVTFGVEPEGLEDLIELDDRGRVPKGTLEELLQRSPADCGILGLNVAATPVSAELWELLRSN